MFLLQSEKSSFYFCPYPESVKFLLVFNRALHFASVMLVEIVRLKNVFSCWEFARRIQFVGADGTKNIIRDIELPSSTAFCYTVRRNTHKITMTSQLNCKNNAPKICFAVSLFRDELILGNFNFVLKLK